MPGSRNKKQVVRALLSAFADTNPPEAGNIVYREGLHYNDVQNLRDRLAGTDWRQIGRNSDSVEEHRNDELSFLTICAMRYYLPGYLLACVKDPYTADVLLDRITDMLSQCTKNGSMGKVLGLDLEELISPMTPEQIQAVAMFVEFEFASYPEYPENASEVLDYWHAASRNQ